jgi:NADPH:quinone reductase-like Zn-dependent oxidoreductase
MRAWTYTTRGLPPTVLTLSSDVPRPSLRPSHVLVQVSHVALNPAGSSLVALVPSIRHKTTTTPSIPELDFAGTVIETASDEFQPGDDVFGSLAPRAVVMGGGGALAEFVVVPEGRVARVPTGVGGREACGLGIAGTTALGLVRDAGIATGDRVLVNGAAGGVGSLVVQVAKMAVGESGVVVAVCSARHMELVTSLGADEVGFFVFLFCRQVFC